MKITGILTALLLCNLCIAEPKPLIKILSIDGGGIRGIIPIKILSHIESKLQSPSITNQFDIMSGTSAGGIIVLLLNLPDENKSPKYSAEDVHRLFKTMGKSIFYSSFFYKLYALNGWSEAKYDDKPLNHYLEVLMGDYTLLDTVKDVIVPAYDLLEEKNYFFRTKKALECRDRVFYLKDIARSTSSAPTYFKPIEIYDAYNINKHIMIDGGVSANNPALCALVYAFKQYGKEADYIVISIGTGSTTGSLKRETTSVPSGKLGWASSIVPLLMDSVNDVTDYQMIEILGPSRYFRLQINIDPLHADMDNVDESNIEALEAYADQYIKDNERIINEIVEILKNA